MLKSVTVGIGTADPDIGDSTMAPPGKPLAGLALRRCHGPCTARLGTYITAHDGWRGAWWRSARRVSKLSSQHVSH